MADAAPSPLEALALRHRPYSTEGARLSVCEWDKNSWPCDTALLLPAALALRDCVEALEGATPMIHDLLGHLASVQGCWLDGCDVRVAALVAARRAFAGEG